MKVIVAEEIQPYVVYRIDGEQMECAFWQFQDGQKALALFLSEDTALRYRETANLGADWKVFCPAKEVLLQLLKSCFEGGIGYAVLDPDRERAKRIFNLKEILQAVEKQN